MFDARFAAETSSTCPGIRQCCAVVLPFLPRDARSGAKHSIAIVGRPSVCLSVCVRDVDVPLAIRLGYFELNNCMNN